MRTKVVCLKMTDAEIEALDSLTRFLSLRSRSETILAGLRGLKPQLAVNPFSSKLVRSSREESYHRVASRKAREEKKSRRAAGQPA